MTNDAYTIRIPKWLLGTVAALLLAGGAFVAGLIVADNDSTTIIEEPDTTTSSTTTTIAETTTTLAATTTTAAPAANGGASPAPTKLAVTLTVSENCPAAGTVPGKITVKWTSTKAVSWDLKVVHGSVTLYWANPGTANGTRSFDTTCNNRKIVGAGGALVNDGGALNYFANITATGAGGKTVNARKEGAA